MNSLQPNLDNNSIPSNDESTSGDEYLSSDEENSTIDESNNQLDLNDLSNLGNHAKYLSNSILRSLDSGDIDKSLALEAQISGNLNNENQRLVEKTRLLSNKLNTIQELCDAYFGIKESTKSSKVERLHNEISTIEKKLERLKHGRQSAFPTSLIKGQSIGIIEKYPVEYYQARDKVLERIRTNSD
ncbi:KXD1 [Candida theae]|uniref:Biogenesis of lysosome-related organelles complex 1 subunit KXD1 n=1 Tax=Candida theae TaxID=1198502 RepID=A0AAD5FYV5_9ASCO|nr:KXD1 [Candida theae]KAI5958350.1 KXD1 [Candida theae]